MAELGTKSVLDEVTCRYTDLSEADLLSADFSGTDLSDADLSGALLSHADFSRADLSDADLSEADLTSADFSGALLSADFSGALLPSANFSGTDLASTDFSGALLPNADLSGAYLSHADLSGAELSEADLSEAHLFDTDLSEAELSETDFSEAHLFDTDLSAADVSYVDFSGASLSETNLLETHLFSADLSEADVSDTDLSGANLSETDLSGIYLSDATARKTNFRSANFGNPDTDHRPTNLENAVFRNADLRGADFTDARLDQIDLTDARIDAQTTFDAETIYEREEDVTSDVRDDGDDAVPPSVWVHRRLERLHEENALSSVARQFHIRKQRARRRHHRRKGEWLGWASLTLLGATMGYGEKPQRVLGTAGAVVGLWTLLYPLGNWIVPNPGTPEAAQRGLDDGTSAAAAAVQYPAYPSSLAELPAYYDAVFGTLADSLYFSTVTFTTLGFGDFSPVGFGRVLATVESALGVTLFAVLVFVLGRRAMR